MDIIKELSEMKETIANEIAEANQRIRQSGGDLNAGDVEIIDKLTHSMKSLATTVAMLEAEEDGRYSNGWGPVYGDTRGTSGRERRTGSGNYGGYSRNDGRYYRGRYSRDDGMMDHLRAMMDEAPDESTRMEIKKLMDKMDQR
jgi:hypothetical protein